MNNYKTYSGIVIALIGVFGLADVFPQIEVEKFVEFAVAIIGLGVAWYGRWHAQQRLTK